MKLAIRTIVFHIICIFVFATIYYMLDSGFKGSSEHGFDKNFLDYLSLAVTLQVGVGYSFLIPTNSYTKLATSIQQIILLSTHIITIYIFTL